MSVNGKTRSIHRIAYELWVGEIPDGHLIRHKCDERSCINPTHLETGLAQDNYNDMVERGRRRTPKGDEHYETKIPSSKFKEIFDKYNKGEISMKQLGKQYGVCAQTICNVLKRHKMLDIEAEESITE
jgi:hypothetical protein